MRRRTDILHIAPSRGGVTFTKIVRGCACWTLKNLTFSIPIFCPISHPSIYHFRKSTQFWPNWVFLFYNNLPKIHPIWIIWAPLSLMNPPPDRYTKFCEKWTQKARTSLVPRTSETRASADTSFFFRYFRGWWSALNKSYQKAGTYTYTRSMWEPPYYS